MSMFVFYAVPSMCIIVLLKFKRHHYVSGIISAPWTRHICLPLLMAGRGRVSSLWPTYYIWPAGARPGHCRSDGAESTPTPFLLLHAPCLCWVTTCGPQSWQHPRRHMRHPAHPQL